MAECDGDEIEEVNEEIGKEDAELREIFLSSTTPASSS